MSEENISLDEEQQNAITFLVDSIISKEPVVCLLGAGGTGKTSIIHKLETAFKIADKKIVFTATSNKAASVMREKIPTAITMHSAVSIYVATKLYTDLEDYFKCEGYNEVADEEYEFQPRTLDFLSSKEQSPKDLISDHGDVDTFFRSLDIDGYNPIVFSHYKTADYMGGVCVIDEASMLPTKSIYKKDEQTGQIKLQTIGLDIIKNIYDTVILVGDDMQLPPINGDSSFNGVPQFHLVKNYRSEKDLLRLMQYAREGKSLELFVPKKGENIRVVNSVSDVVLKNSADPKMDIAHIVYRNKTRQELTKKIRGNDPQPREEEPIVYYGANINDPGDTIAKNEIGIYSDGFGEWANHRQVINARNFDEYNTDHRVFSMLRYGYALTCHSAQGSQFDHVVVHLGDVPGFIDYETQVKWAYTAVSRAKKSILLIR